MFNILSLKNNCAHASNNTDEITYKTAIRFLGMRSINYIRVPRDYFSPCLRSFWHLSNETRSHYKFSRLIYWHKNGYNIVAKRGAGFRFLIVTTYAKRDNRPCSVLLYVNTPSHGLRK